MVIAIILIILLLGGGLGYYGNGLGWGYAGWSPLGLILVVLLILLLTGHI